MDINYLNSILFVMLFVIVSCSKSHRLNEIKQITDFLKINDQIKEIYYPNKKDATINGIKFCIDNKICSNKENIKYARLLEDLEIPQNEMIWLWRLLKKSNTRHLYNHKDIYLWIEGGAFGDISGIVIFPDNVEPKDFKFKNYQIYIGKQLGENMYYFSG